MMVLGFLRAYELMQPKERVEEIRVRTSSDTRYPVNITIAKAQANGH